MKFSPSEAFAEYGHVLLPGLAGVIGLAALSSQWIENHRLRGELEKLDSERSVEVQQAVTQATGGQEKRRAQAADFNRWADAMNAYIVVMNREKALSKQKVNEVSYREAAQGIVTMYKAGVAAGVLWPGPTREDRIQSVIMGASATGGPFAGKFFKYKDTPMVELVSIAKYIGFTPQDGLSFDGEGRQGGFSGLSDSGVILDPSEQIPPVPRLPES